ncbi:hypothetical protein JQ604_10960 [Bradyrhizobium jicamae]|uniref:hypothetical protein n=1 Tax=Bradyrhizobium jicamae TaxID=280332 RepID=UPI001BABDFE0|nr:hypothetical protein [Bradyrhizobium jicamae]MBR0752705.1 hypothetical protein [Bradyrhizobium jicamae]
MVEWLTTYWPAMLVGFVFGMLFSLVREFWRRFVFAAVLFLITYRVLLKAMGHAEPQWDHWLAGAAILGVFAGCLVRPSAAGIARKVASALHSSQ